MSPIFRFPNACRCCRVSVSFPFLASRFPLRVFHYTPTMPHASGSASLYTHNASRILVCFLQQPSRVVQWRPSFSCFASAKMVEHISQVIMEYEERLRSYYVPRFSYGRWMLRDDGAPNRCFLMYLFSEESIAIQFLKDNGLLRSRTLCNTCGRDMTWSVAHSVPEGFCWRCQRRVGGVRCNQSASIKQGSWFHHSNLTLHEIMLITYDIVHREQALHTQSEYCLSAHTVVCFAGKPCWCFWSAPPLRLVVLIRPSKLMRACSVGASIIGDTLSRVSGCLAVLNESPAKHFLFPYPTELPTH